MNAKHTPSQCQVLGIPAVRTWKDYREGCLATYGGGHHERETLDAFRHGMETVFNLLEAEFPPAETCKAAPELLEACKAALAWFGNLKDWEGVGDPDIDGIRAAIFKAEGRE